MKKMKYHDNTPVKPQPEIVIKEVIREVIKEVPVYQPPQIITKEIIKEVQSPHLIEEINRLTQRLAEKDEIIRQMSFEKDFLIGEINGLKEDKTELRSDKVILYEEIGFLRDAREELQQKNSELMKKKSIGLNDLLIQKEEINLNIDEIEQFEKAELLGDKLYLPE